MKPGRRIPWLAIFVIAGAISAMVLSWAVATLHLRLPSCPLKVALGIPCLTCGGTRCAMALSGGHLGEAFHWHPLLAVLGILSPGVVLWDLRRAWRGDSYPEWPQGWPVRVAAAFLLAATWILQVARGI